MKLIDKNKRKGVLSMRLYFNSKYFILMIMHLFASFSNSCEPNFDVCFYFPCSFVRDFLNNISNNLFGKDLDLDEVEETVDNNYQLIRSDEDALSLSMLPQDILLIIAKMLPPPDIVNLSKTHSDFHFIINEEFWKSYNSFHSYKIWNMNLPAIKISYGYFWHQKNEITKAALLGYPEAVRQAHQNRKAYYPKQNYHVEWPYDNHTATTKHDILRRKFNASQFH